MVEDGVLHVVDVALRVALDVTQVSALQLGHTVQQGPEPISGVGGVETGRQSHGTDRGALGYRLDGQRER